MTRHSACDVVVIGAGAVGAAVAWYATGAGLSVTVVERGAIVSGSSSSCEGNLLVSDKEPGPELDLALYSHRVWADELVDFRALWEFDFKGGLVVAATTEGRDGLTDLAERQRAAGVIVQDVPLDEVPTLEPHLTRDIASAAFYPQDCQVQPILLAAHLLRMARSRGATVHTDTPVTGFVTAGDRVTGVRTSSGEISAPIVVNCAGAWAGEVAALAGNHLPVLPRRGFVLVTEPLPPTVFHKVYAGEYVAATQSGDAGLQTSTVIEGTEGGTVLIGSSRERVGFDKTPSLPAIREIAAKALRLYPSLRQVSVMRTYLGFRPYCPDHLPVIGEDPRTPGLWHATGHEGAGIGLSVGTAKLLVQAMTGQPTELPLTPFAPDRPTLAPAPTGVPT
ncbi:FAD-dependent oxidoreductase [Gordonia amarae]|uniref:FAD-dependent oxidoreductase n=2 Tax=Gordonia amarae TaxID=36821 RepID=A0A857L1B0_9ACTN|nr:FAD-dependent oxidoreductase [Gordonia amarae]MCS3878954.1 glycine/D-amino acid oxidase-like deaminating enzyme [Gordonia amarae]QHN17501.1 FAD-dependent oxidoreductase [Gordonia amarae]QHN22027.1 FAD-dependent oxidoreductase [Gordonia amarae]QHN30908.1 FAD-dependent oxidoreductase [Gordonia amarae]QHN39654.1 FAD-dependent oxidoreductase [Gordonia amarae]